MNREKYEKYLKKTHIPLPKSAVDTNILLTLIANVALYYFFRNIVETVISAILFVVFSVALIRNRNYLREYDSSLLVKTSLVAYWFWLSLMFLVLFQLYFKISYLLFILEFCLFIPSFILAKKAVYKMFDENEYAIDFSATKKASKVGAKIGGVIYTITVIVNLPFIESVAWYTLSLCIFIIVLVISHVFSSVLIVCIGFLKYYND